MRLYSKSNDSVWELMPKCAFNTESGACRHTSRKAVKRKCYYNKTGKIPSDCSLTDTSHKESIRGI
jgi:hypothetical protein